MSAVRDSLPPSISTRGGQRYRGNVKMYHVTGAIVYHVTGAIVFFSHLSSLSNAHIPLPKHAHSLFTVQGAQQSGMPPGGGGDGGDKVRAYRPSFTLH